MRKSSFARRPANNVRTKSFALKGGLNIVDAPLTIPDGQCLAAINYELLTTDGYRRVDGFERYDGQPSPSDASYWLINFNVGSVVEPEIDSIVTGTTSGATGKVGLVVVTSGAWATNNATGYIILFSVSGNFTDADALVFTGAGDAFNYGFSNGMG